MRLEPPWVTCDAVAKVHAKLRRCGIDSTAKLEEALANDLNAKIKSSGGTTFRARSLSVMRELLGA